jgi:hypothetical protein
MKGIIIGSFMYSLVGFCVHAMLILRNSLFDKKKISYKIGNALIIISLFNLLLGI